MKRWREHREQRKQIDEDRLAPVPDGEDEQRQRRERRRILPRDEFET